MPVNEPVQEQSQSMSRLLVTSLRIYLEDIFCHGTPSRNSGMPLPVGGGSV
eukprot:COSAG01_NODE_1673_length_9542_cov_12.825765_5_plen_51_part_00